MYSKRFHFVETDHYFMREFFLAVFFRINLIYRQSINCENNGENPYP
jgi:hypothetical protein